MRLEGFCVLTYIGIRPLLLGLTGRCKERRTLTCAGDALSENDESPVLSANVLDKREFVTLYEDDRLVHWLQFQPDLF